MLAVRDLRVSIPTLRDAVFSTQNRSESQGNVVYGREWYTPTDIRVDE